MSLNVNFLIYFDDFIPTCTFQKCQSKALPTPLKFQSEVCAMILDCCAQQRTYEKFFGLLAQRFCMLKKEFMTPFQDLFREQYDTCHRLETNKLRNVGRFFSHLLHSDAISWEVRQLGVFCIARDATFPTFYRVLRRSKIAHTRMTKTCWETLLTCL